MSDATHGAFMIRKAFELYTAIISLPRLWGPLNQQSFASDHWSTPYTTGVVFPWPKG